MAESTVYKYYKDLPSWAKGIVVVGSLAMGYAVVTSIMNKIKAASDRAKQEKELNTADAELKNEERAGRGQTLSNSTLEAMSTSIVEASNDCGTEDDLFLSQFDKVKNQADMLAFIKVFGLRQKIRCPYTSDSRVDTWCWYGCLTQPMSLSLMVASELSQGQIDKINKKLAAKGITYII
jgi:hypothetical protein